MGEPAFFSKANNTDAILKLSAEKKYEQLERMLNETYYTSLRPGTGPSSFLIKYNLL